MRRLFPGSPRFGGNVIRLDDGTVTFHERGFVSADSPVALLARHNYEVECIRRILRDRRFHNSLEIGCGFGRLSPIFARASQRHQAVDINTDALAIARQTYPAVSFELGSATALPFRDGQFDFVVTWTVIQHVPPDRIQAACEEIKRVLAPGGLLLTCEETRYATRPVSARAHTWHRAIEDYAKMFSPLALESSGDIVEIDRLPGQESPGTVMVWTSTAKTP